jgi:rhodanese-related sulfurtransferase
VPVREITPRALAEELKRPGEERPILLDVRSADELRLASIGGAVHIPMNELPARLDELREVWAGRAVVVLCHSGVRSWHAAAFLDSAGIPAASLAGGIDRWSVEVDPRVPRY